ncbi:S53 family peptidase [Nocardioides pocheonensis]|uniref:Protease n=1 Tax=Nocardioides pocheonensis TaxID=661485 RepID=A0A3N0GX63_9ACTN|nr:S53 family peptidase [Nocardioides pocheonensis]RNM16720.1 protease [Nocardioides pocheonensis]
MHSSTVRRATGALFALTLGALSLNAATTTPTAAHGVLMHPTASDYVQVSSSETPPTEAQCFSVGRRCFTPQSTRAAYNVNPLYADGFDGTGTTIAVVDSYGSDTMAHDLHVYDQAFGLPAMCGEEGVTCAPGMPTFSQFHFQGSPATKAQPGKGTHQEDKSAWALEVALDVETAHAMAPGANILLVTTPTAETLGVQGFPDMINAEQYVIDHHMADVISQSFASAEDAFGSKQSLLNLRHAYISAQQAGITVLGSSGDGGSANGGKSPVGKGGSTFPYPTVEWPASDPLVTGVGGTYLCTDPTNTTSRVVDSADPPAKCQANPGQAEVGWTFSGGGFSHVFGKPGYQDPLPAGSTAIGTMRGVPDIALQASAGTGALVYLSLPPDGQSGLICGSAPCSTGWYDIGGTSLACPEWAGLVAIADQIAGHDLGLINPRLYELASNPTSYANDFYDITVGNNTADPNVTGYPATTGWDPVTGLGTPNAAALLPALAAG